MTEQDIRKRIDEEMFISKQKGLILEFEDIIDKREGIENLITELEKDEKVKEYKEIMGELHRLDLKLKYIGLMGIKSPRTKEKWLKSQGKLQNIFAKKRTFLVENKSRIKQLKKVISVQEYEANKNDLESLTKTAKAKAKEIIDAHYNHCEHIYTLYFYGGYDGHEGRYYDPHYACIKCGRSKEGINSRALTVPPDYVVKSRYYLYLVGMFPLKVKKDNKYDINHFDVPFLKISAIYKRLEKKHPGMDNEDLIRYLKRASKILKVIQKRSDVDCIKTSNEKDGRHLSR